MPNEEQRKKQIKHIIAENFEQLITANKPKIKEAYKVPTKINTKKSTLNTYHIHTRTEKKRQKENLKPEHKKTP